MIILHPEYVKYESIAFLTWKVSNHVFLGMIMVILVVDVVMLRCYG
jgi:hypothetical protein